MKKTKYYNAKILIVDDNPANIELLEFYLGSKGYNNILSTTNSREVAGLYQSFCPDIILLDIMMPEMNGFDVLDKLKTLVHPKTYLPILVLTADDSTASKEKALTMGAKDFLAKPFDLNEAQIRINNLLETKFLYYLLEEKNSELKHKVKARTYELEKAYNEIKMINEQLESLDFAKLEFLNIISHELRTPLNGIKGFTELLKDQISSPQLSAYLQYLESSVERLEKFSLQALLISQLRTKMYKPETENLSVIALLHESENALKQKAIKKNIQIEYQKDVNLNYIKADPKLMKVCFESLIDNAINHSAENETVLMNAYFEHKKICIEFSNRGTCFSDEAIKKLYNLFGIGEKHIDKNNGLSLALVKLIMDAHNGNIVVINNKPVGATVKLIFKDN